MTIQEQKHINAYLESDNVLDMKISMNGIHETIWEYVKTILIKQNYDNWKYKSDFDQAMKMMSEKTGMEGQNLTNHILNDRENQVKLCFLFVFCVQIGINILNLILSQFCNIVSPV